MMTSRPDPSEIAMTLLDQEARALLTRLDQARPFVLNETMVLAAALPQRAQRSIERFLFDGRVALRRKVHRFRDWLHTEGSMASPAEQQRRFVNIRLAFNDVLSQFDLFTEVVTQRSESETGVWLSGLDTLAAEALTLDVRGYEPPPVVCYLARGPGAAIRRARTRLPGGRPNPVGVIRVPRERMVGHGIASSLVHEVGHQGAALLGLVDSLREELRRKCKRRSAAAIEPWQNWDLTVSECVADFWSVAKLGISSTLGLLAVVSLPRYFVFRAPGGDVHPTPYLRVLLSIEVGRTLYPHAQWDTLEETWKQLYPVAGLPRTLRQQLEGIEATIPEFAQILASHRPASLLGSRLADVMPLEQRRPDQLLGLHAKWRNDLAMLARQPPTLVFAVIGQARAAQRISPERESELLSAVLRAWAARSSLEVLEPHECAQAAFAFAS
jgi:hypothetical protein